MTTTIGATPSPSPSPSPSSPSRSRPARDRLTQRLTRRLAALSGRSLPLPVIAFQRSRLWAGTRGLATSHTVRRVLTADSELRVATHGGVSYAAAPLPGPRLATVTERNLALVVDLLEANGIDHFVVENRSPTSTALAVREQDRVRVLQAMRAAWTDQPVYVALARKAVSSFERPVLARWGLRAPAASKVGVLRVFRAYSSGTLTLTRDFACDLEFWHLDQTGEHLVAPRPNRVAAAVPVDSVRTQVPLDGRTYRGIEPFSVTTPLDIDFPIDIVYTWVDGSDPAWIARRDDHLGRTGTTSLNEAAADASRYLSRDELRYSLRSVEMFAPWVRNVYIVTDDQVPPWLDTDHPRVRVVDHREIFADPSMLPTFNSHAIESQLHHIEGLAEHYIYLNDDMLFGRPVAPTAFFHPNGIAKMFVSPAQVDYGKPSLRDLPVTAAGKNNRQLILDDFGRYLTQKQKHAPYPHRRSVLVEMEQRYAAEFARTAANRFRHPTDISIAASLQQSYGFLTGRTTPARLEYTYVDLASAGAAAKLRSLGQRRRYDAFCLNDTDSDTIDLEAQLEMVRSFCESFFPLPASCERD